MQRKEFEFRSENTQEPRVRSMEELMDAFKGPSLKRASRLLNPLDDHPFLSTIDDLSPMVNAVVLKAAGPVSFNRQIGRDDARSFQKLEAKKPGVAKKMSDSLAEEGYVLLADILTHDLDQPANSMYTQQEVPVRKGMYHNVTQRSVVNLTKDPETLVCLEFLNQVIREELFANEYTPDQQKALLANTIGLAQSVAVHGAYDFIRGDKSTISSDNKAQSRRKNVVRDNILVYAFRVLRAEGQKGMADYFVAQKAYLAEMGYKKRN